MAKPRLACRECHLIQESEHPDACPNCNSTSFTEDWAGYVIIAHPEESDIAAAMEVTRPGTYALKVR
ncbi:MAG: transcription elongation factor subunit Spt4 [Halobacteriales archaeon]